MASASNSGSLGAVAMSVSRLTLKLALNQTLTNRSVMDYLARRMYQDEEQREDWTSLAPAQRAIWMERTRSAVAALADTVGG